MHVRLTHLMSIFTPFHKVTHVYRNCESIWHLSVPGGSTNTQVWLQDLRLESNAKIFVPYTKCLLNASRPTSQTRRLMVPSQD